MRKRFVFLVVCLAPALAALLVAIGCREQAPLLDGADSGFEDSEYREELFTVAMDNLGRLEQFRAGEMLQEIVERLNQWAATQPPPERWSPDPLVETLPEPLRSLPMLADLDRMRFPRHDGADLQQAVWLRDVARWARGDRLDELSRAMHLFDWTVRNIQLDSLDELSPQPGHAPMNQFPWETLLLGRAGVLDRAWVFIELLRQEGIDAAVLALPPRRVGGSAGLRAWVVGVLIGDDVHLFDPVLGLPIPGPDGASLDDDGQLALRPATLAEAASDPNILSRLDLDTSTPYPVGPADLDDLTALVAATPSQLSRRMALVESRLVGEQKLVLTVDAQRQGRRFAGTPRIGGARLWAQPYETMRQQLMLGENPQVMQQRFAEMAPFQVGQDSALWRGRILHLKGQLVGEDSATQYYQAARPADRQIESLDDVFYHMLKAAQPDADEAELREAVAQRLAMEKPVFVRAKQNASYWLGLLSYERGAFPAAIDYFATRTLEASPGGPWTHGARYNLARTFEAAGDWQSAISQLASDPLSPSRHGNLLRARWLNELRHRREGNAD